MDLSINDWIHKLVNKRMSSSMKYLTNECTTKEGINLQMNEWIYKCMYEWKFVLLIYSFICKFNHSSILIHFLFIIL